VQPEFRTDSTSQLTLHGDRKVGEKKIGRKEGKGKEGGEEKEKKP